MGTRKKSVDGASPFRRQVLVVGARVMLIVAGVSLLVAALVAGWFFLGHGIGGGGIFRPESQPSLVQAPNWPDDASPVLETNPLETNAFSPVESLPVPPPPDVANGMRIGIVSGHAGYDSGAVCPDGLAEAEVNQVVAQEVATQLVGLGYEVDLLEEYDDQLPGYTANALVSIHADSCNVPGATGFKVARITNSAIPESEDRLVGCIYDQYEAVTGLARHPNSITDNMTNYHAFWEIDSHTPGVIIETGFMLVDRRILVQRPGLIAQGIVAGVVCFLEQDSED